jgi:general secretion pathway protein D
VRIIADKPTNSLIVMSSGRDYFALKEVIRQLDIPKRQVYIETVILEVQAGNDLGFGTSTHGGIPGKKGMLVGGVQLPQLSSLSLASLGTGGATLPTGLVGALIGKELESSQSFLGKSIPSYGVLFQALASNDNAKLVSAPSIIGVDNEESKHKTGLNISYQRGTSTFANGGVTTQNNFERKPLNLELTIKPHVFVDDQVLLELKLDSEDLGGTDANGQPIWTNRAIDTRVVIRDQQTVVIGSLTQERNVSNQSKVPFLGDIPLLGHLFKYTSTQKRKTNLVVMLTPYIVKDQLDLQHILDRKLRENQEFTGSFALDTARYTPKIDYTRKRGLVEEINRTVITIDEDIATRSSLRQPARVEPGPIEYGP